MSSSAGHYSGTFAVFVSNDDVIEMLDTRRTDDSLPFISGGEVHMTMKCDISALVDMAREMTPERFKDLAEDENPEVAQVDDGFTVTFTFDLND